MAPEVLAFAVEGLPVPNTGYAIPPARSVFGGCEVWSFVTYGFGLMLKLDDKPFEHEDLRRSVLNGGTGMIGYVKAFAPEDMADFRQIIDNLKQPGRLRPLA